MKEEVFPSKESIRKEARQVRAALPPLIRREKSRQIEERLFSMDQIRRGKTISLYISYRDEVETESMIKRALRAGKRVCAPVCRSLDKRIEMMLIEDGAEGLLRGAYGIPEPVDHPDRLVRLEEIEVIILPALAYDPTGARLGSGFGCYDRFLLDMGLGATTLVGLAFDAQIAQMLPTEPHDIRVDYIVTETGVIDCARKRS